MKTIPQHIEHVRAQPHHVRKHIALTTAGAISVFIGLVWFGANLVTGSFALHGTNFAAATSQGNTPVTTVNANGDALAGAAAATQNNGKAQIEIVDTTPQATTTPSQAEKTVLPF